MPRPRPAACCCCACCCAIPSPLASTVFSQTLSLSLRRALSVSLFLAFSLSLQRGCSRDTMGSWFWCPKERRKKCLRRNPIFRGTFSFRCLEEARRRKEMWNPRYLFSKQFYLFIYLFLYSLKKREEGKVANCKFHALFFNWQNFNEKRNYTLKFLNEMIFKNFKTI